MKSLNWFVLLGLVLFGCEKISEDQVIDFDGNIYGTIQIGTQGWMSENLRTTRLNDGTKIQLIPKSEEWTVVESPGYCWYGNNEAFFSLNHFGALYNGYSVNTGKLCPDGWHVPTDDDWYELRSYVGLNSEGAKLKEAGNINWASPNSDATNESGFTALPGGIRSGSSGYYRSFRYNADFWSFQSNNSFGLNYYDSSSNNYGRQMKDGASVRCIKDTK